MTRSRDRRALEYAARNARDTARHAIQFRTGAPRNRAHYNDDRDKWTCPECGTTVSAEPGDWFPDCRCISEAVQAAHDATVAEYWPEAVQTHLEAARIPRRFSRAGFDNFAPRPGAEDALKACMAYAEAFSFRDTEHGLLLLGHPGNGKTHLAVATMRRAIERTLVYGTFTTAADLIAECWKGSGRREWDDAPLRRAKDAELLILDDLGQEHANEFVRTKLHELLDARYQAARPTIVTSNHSEDEIAGRIGEPALSRIREMCDRHVVTATDYRPAMAERRRAG